MVTVIDITVYSVVFFLALFVAVVFYISTKRFLKGEFKDFLEWTAGGFVTFVFGTLLLLLNAAYMNTIYSKTFLIIAGFALVLTSIYFIKAAWILNRISMVYGFAGIKSDHVFKSKKSK